MAKGGYLEVNNFQLLAGDDRESPLNAWSTSHYAMIVDSPVFEVDSRSLRVRSGQYAGPDAINDYPYSIRPTILCLDFQFRFSALPSIPATIWKSEYFSGVDEHMAIVLGTDGKVSWRFEEGSALSTGGTTLAPNTWYHTQIKLAYHATTGGAEVYIDDVLQFSQFDQDTATDPLFFGSIIGGFNDVYLGPESGGGVDFYYANFAMRAGSYPVEDEVWSSDFDPAQADYLGGQDLIDYGEALAAAYDFLRDSDEIYFDQDLSTFWFDSAPYSVRTFNGVDGIEVGSDELGQRTIAVRGKFYINPSDDPIQATATFGAGLNGLVTFSGTGNDGYFGTGSNGYVLNAALAGSPSQPLSASYNKLTFVITLTYGTNGGGANDPTKNSAAQVAAIIAALTQTPDVGPVFNAVASGDGTGQVTETGSFETTGGIDASGGFLDDDDIIEVWSYDDDQLLEIQMHLDGTFFASVLGGSDIESVVGAVLGENTFELLLVLSADGGFRFTVNDLVVFDEMAGLPGFVEPTPSTPSSATIGSGANAQVAITATQNDGEYGTDSNGYSITRQLNTGNNNPLLVTYSPFTLLIKYGTDGAGVNAPAKNTATLIAAAINALLLSTPGQGAPFVAVPSGDGTGSLSSIGTTVTSGGVDADGGDGRVGRFQLEAGFFSDQPPIWWDSLEARSAEFPVVPEEEDPVRSDPLVIDADGAAVNLGGGLVGLPVTLHGLAPGVAFNLQGTNAYDGTYIVQPSSTTDEIVIVARFTTETFVGDERVIELPQKIYKPEWLLTINVPA